MRAAAARVSLYVLRLDAGGGFADASRSVRARAISRTRTCGAGEWTPWPAWRAGPSSTWWGAPKPPTTGSPANSRAITFIGFEPEPGDRDGRDHSIEVKVARRNVTLRARDSLNIPAAGAGPKDEQRLALMMSAPFPATELGLRVGTYSLGDATGRVRGGGERARWSGRGGTLAVAFALVDGKGKMAGSGLQRLPAADRPGPRMPSSEPLSSHPGVYTLKLAALDGSGRKGNVEHAVKAALIAAGGLELGDLLVGPPGRRRSGPPPFARPAGGRAAW